MRIYRRMINDKKVQKSIILTAIILVQVIMLFLIFSKCKQGFHSDEVWSYGFANSVESKELDIANDGTSLMNKWRDSEDFRRYITVEPDQRFRYDAVLYNTNNDYNPPLQLLILHTICSFFPGKFSWYFCFGLNIFAFIVSQIYIFRLVRRMTGNDIVAFGAVALYGFGAGGMSITIFLRLYALGAMFAIMFAYYSHRIYEESRENKLPVKELILLALTCFGGAYTLHIFLITAFFITLFYVVYYLFAKRVKFFFAHGFACLIPVGITILLDPKVFMQVGGVDASAHGYAETSYPFGMQLRQYLYMLTRDIYGVHILSYANVILESVLVILGGLIIFCIPIVVLVHKETWFKTFLSKSKNRFKQIGSKRKNFQFTHLALFISILATVLVVSGRSSTFLMGAYANRYIFIVYPLAAAWMAGLLYYIVYLLTMRSKIATVIALVVCIVLAGTTYLMDNTGGYYFRHEEEGKTLTQLEPDSCNVIVVNEDWLTVCFAPELYNTKEFYAANFETFKDDAVFKDADPSVPHYLIVDQKFILEDGVTYEDKEKSFFYMAHKDHIYTEEDFLAFYKGLDEVEDIEYVGLDGFFGRTCKIYKVTLHAD